MNNSEKIVKFLETLNIMNMESNESVPGLIMSSPGAGKTTFLNLWAKAKGYGAMSVIASQYGADDLAGLQTVNKKKDGTVDLKRLKPDWFVNLEDMSRKFERVVLFIDELTTCNEFIQSTLLDIITSRKVGHLYDIPKNVMIVAAGNYADQLNNEFAMMAPTVNRFMILNLKTRFNDFKDIDVSTDLWSMNQEQAIAFLGLKELKKVSGKIDMEKLTETLYETVYQNAENSAADEQMTQNSAKTGLLGIATARSWKNGLRFASVYNTYFNDGLKEVAMTVLGDTLGVCPLGTVYAGTPVTKILLESFNKYAKATKGKKGANPLSKYLEERAKEQKFTDAKNTELTKYFSSFKDAPVGDQQIMLDYLRQHPQDILSLLIPVDSIPDDLKEKLRNGK